MGSTISIYVSVTFISLASAESIRMTCVMASGITMLSLFWEERITFKRLSIAALCTFGVMMVIQPEFIFTGEQHVRVICTYNNTMVANETMETITTTECKHKGMATTAIGYALGNLGRMFHFR